MVTPSDAPNERPAFPIEALPIHRASLAVMTGVPALIGDCRWPVRFVTMKTQPNAGKSKRDAQAGKQRLIEGCFMGQSIAVGPCGPGEHSSKLIRSQRPRQTRHSTGLARDARPLPERFTLEARVLCRWRPTHGVVRGSQRTNRQRTTGA